MSIVCASDLSPASRVGVRAAAALAARLGDNQLSLVHVLDAGLAHRLGSEQFRKLKEDTERSLLDEARESVAAFGQVTVHPEVLVGTAADALHEFARTKPAAVLVLASQGHGAAPLYRLGGTSERVAAEAQIPVIVVRDAAPFEAWARGERALRVVVGVDFHARSDAAIHLAERLRRAGHCQLVFAHIYYWHEGGARYGIATAGEGSMVDGDERVEALLRRDLANRVASISGEGNATIVAKLGLGRLGDHLLELAETEKADLVVVGARRHVGARRLASVSSVVLHFGHASIACAPRDEVAHALLAPRPVRCVLIATDFSSFADQAIAHGYGLLSDRGGEVHLVHVESAATAPSPRAEQVQRLRALVPAWAAERGIVTRTHVVHGEEIARSIVEAAQRAAADVVCIASHGRAGIARALLGSVADRVIRDSVVPVLVVRPTQ